VHQGGVPFDVAALRAAAARWDVALVEDAACAAGSTVSSGSTVDQRPAGAGALLAAWSFHPRKVITTGEGGMITTDDAEWAARLRRLREHGMNMSAADRHASAQPVLESYLETGFNYRMTDIQAAVGLVQLGRLPGLVARRRELAAHYQSLLAGVPGVVTVRDPAHGHTNFQSFWVRLEHADRDAVLTALAAAGVSARRGIMAAHLEPAYAMALDLPNTSLLTHRSLILPLHHEMTADDQRYVVDVLRAAL
jgi:perosamine synthetase